MALVKPIIISIIVGIYFGGALNNGLFWTPMISMLMFKTIDQQIQIQVANQATNANFERLVKTLNIGPNVQQF